MHPLDKRNFTMVTTVGMNADFEGLIKDLIELEYDAIGAYHACIERFENTQYKMQLQEFVSDHEQHLQDLQQCARTYNIEIPDGPDMKALLAKGKIVMADMFGDKAILMAMKTNEDDTVTAYERACEFDDVPSDVLPIFQKGHADELRHRAWMETTAKTDQQRAA